MTAMPENNRPARAQAERSILQINRLDYVKMHAKILSATDKRLKKYLQFASEQMGTKITNDDVVEYALNLLFDRDGAFKSWSRSKA
jgi:hypothetical protein